MLTIERYDDAITLDVVFQVPWEWQEREKIRAIKAWRVSMPIGLREAKEIVEAGERTSGVAVRMSAESYGRLSAAVHGTRCCVYIDSIVEPSKAVFYDTTR